ncbi:MAG TPA: hypothetical protein ENN80_04785 [Candidatus Hydrogenedentes bacterium]|nr:hypothetical protein [Candidatus Hydrogenedentota bacterium]
MLRFKLDKNADPRWREPLEEAGNRVSTVREEGLQGTDDGTLVDVCRDEGLCLITADLDFAQTIQYPPHAYHGLIVLRHPKPTLRQLLQQVAMATKEESPVGRPWIVEPGSIRIHGAEFGG